MKSTVGAASLWAESAGKSRHEAPNREIVRLRVPTPRSLLVQATDHVPASNDKSYLPPAPQYGSPPGTPQYEPPPRWPILWPIASRHRLAAKLPSDEARRIVALKLAVKREAPLIQEVQ